MLEYFQFYRLFDFCEVFKCKHKAVKAPFHLITTLLQHFILESQWILDTLSRPSLLSLTYILNNMYVYVVGCATHHPCARVSSFKSQRVRQFSMFMILNLIDSMSNYAAHARRLLCAIKFIKELDNVHVHVRIQLLPNLAYCICCSLPSATRLTMVSFDDTFLFDEYLHVEIDDTF